MERYFKQLKAKGYGRAVNSDYYKKAIDSLPNSADEVFKRKELFVKFEITNRNNDVPNQGKELPSEVIKREFNRPITQQEQLKINEMKAINAKYKEQGKEQKSMDLEKPKVTKGHQIEM